MLVNNQFSNFYYTDHIGIAYVQTVLAVDESLLAGQLQMTEQHSSQRYSNYIVYYREIQQAIIKKCETEDFMP